MDELVTPIPVNILQVDLVLSKGSREQVHPIAPDFETLLRGLPITEGG